MNQLRLSAFFCALYLVSPNSSALSDIDREYCEKLHRALVALQPVVDAAKQGNEAGQVIVNWSKVDQDIQTIVNGLNKALTLPRREPRLLEIKESNQVVTGDYLE